ncbi:hypothetical protein VSS74_24900 [Conexibacter stalactiti]|uniref:Uncharacterized protein n=1 Tax=Conexibacter stalactiti TaxID=1940611 RepID=A0ABU4HWL1_9ACTN|nr:hypothetical protein [Conexibacter stalactiti]MDW5597613.1 hypothetical protein [Conexibacter stalactiti]MEC5038255.1 hypothetical protein [Conexibacter stalactiti]
MFGGKQDDDDPFAALKEAAERGSTRVTSGAAAPSHGDEGNVSSTPLAQVPGGDRGRRRGNAGLVLLLVALSLGGAGAAIYLAERDATENATRADRGERPAGDERGDDGPGQSGSDDDPAPDPRHFDLVRPTGFARALRAIEPELRPGEGVRMLRVAHDRVNAFTRTRSGAQRMIDVDDELQTSSRDAGQAGSHRGMSLSRVPATAPSQAVARAARQGGFPASKLDYLVMSTPLISGDVEWSLFFRGVAQRNTHWIAQLDGRKVWRPGEKPGTTTSSSSVTIRRNGSTTTLTGADAQRINDCIRRAGSDGAKIQACLP